MQAADLMRLIREEAPKHLGQHERLGRVWFQFNIVMAKVHRGKHTSYFGFDAEETRQTKGWLKQAIKVRVRMALS